MKLYREVLIESAEQAEALPHGTPVKVGPFLAWRMDGSWDMTLTDVGYSSTEEFMRAFADDWPYVALVPVEAEEESANNDSAATIRMLRERGDALKTRLVTPWEES